MSTSLHLSARPPETASPEERSLARAFTCFTEAAGSLERGYAQLQGEVARLRHELEETNRDLARSLEENHLMREHLNRILEGLPCGVLVLEAEGQVSIANPEARRLLAVAAETRLEHAAQFPPPAADWLERSRARGGEQEYPCPAGEGEEPRWLAVRHARLEANGGRASSIFILRDTSEQKRLEREREAMRRQQALAEMAAMLAHEIRNPLGSLELFAGLLAESVLNEENRPWVEHLQAGLRTLAATVNNVLHFHNLPGPELAPTDLGELLSWAGGFLAPLAKQAGVRLEVVNQLEGVVVAADRHRLEQVLLNLALNALRCMTGGGALHLVGQVRRQAEGASAQLEVADSGPGIAPENLGRIFEPGFTTRPGSPGLGLAVCRKIVEQHGGTIGATSFPGRGATFTVQFPLKGDGR